MMEKELELKSSIDNTISPSSTNFSGSTAVEDLDLEAQQARQSGLWSKSMLPDEYISSLY